MKNTHEAVFSLRLNEALAELGLSQSELARRIAVTPQAVQRWCNGDSTPRAKALSALAEATGKPEHWFYLPYESEAPALATHSSTGQFSGERTTSFLLPDEEELLSIYRDLPGPERKNMLAVFGARRDEINKFLAEISKK
ncbi:MULTISPECIES: helix-turn-helix domain-containing protein [unclassified Serratia (in: enterobacteria)]|uniref:helix-turn-helix domain-containing protein n=1 Tax=unclassified Serratia (in: enterobacteria) TaxID=2647522 RepID=UPI0030764575